MAVLKKMPFVGAVEALLINEDPADLSSLKVNSVIASYAGFDGDVHTGLTRQSCVRVKAQYPVGTEIRNTRQVSVVAVEELVQIASKMQVGEIKPEWLGVNLLVSGIPDLSQLSPSTRLIFSGGVSLVVDTENEPCKYPGEIIERFYPGTGKRFASAAMGLRGLTGWIERTGAIETGETIELHIPTQRLYVANSP